MGENTDKRRMDALDGLTSLSVQDTDECKEHGVRMFFSDQTLYTEHASLRDFSDLVIDMEDMLAFMEIGWSRWHDTAQEAQMKARDIWAVQKAMMAYEDLINLSNKMEDDDLAREVKKITDTLPATSMVKHQRLEDLLRYRAKSFCDRMGIPLEQYDGPLQWRLHKVPITNKQ